MIVIITVLVAQNADKRHTFHSAIVCIICSVVVHVQGCGSGMVRGPGVGTLGPSTGEEPHDVSEVSKRFIVTRVSNYPCGGGPDIRRLQGQEAG